MLTPQRSPFSQHFGANWLSPSLAFFPSPYPSMDASSGTCRQLDDSLGTCPAAPPGSVEALKAEASRLLHGGRLREAVAAAEAALAALRSGPAAAPGPAAPPEGRGVPPDVQRQADAVYLTLLAGEAQVHLGEWGNARHRLLDARARLAALAPAPPGSPAAALAGLLAAACEADLAYLHHLEGDLEAALQLYSDVLRRQTALAGAESLDAATCMNAIGVVLLGLGRCEAALETFFRCHAVRQQLAQQRGVALPALPEGDPPPPVLLAPSIASPTAAVVLDPTASPIAPNSSAASSSSSSSSPSGDAVRPRPNRVTFSLSPSKQSLTPTTLPWTPGRPSTGTSAATPSPTSPRPATTADDARLTLDCATTFGNIGNAYLHLHQYGRALEYYAAGQRLVAGALSPQHPDVATALVNMGGALQRLEEPGRAYECYHEAWRLRQRLFGEGHILTTACHIALADVLLTFDSVDEAALRYSHALSLRELHHGPDALPCAACYAGLGHVHLAKRRAAEAEGWYRRAHHVYCEALGEAHPEAITALCSVATAQFQGGDHPAAYATLEDALRLTEAAVGDSDPSVAVLCNNLGNVLRARAQPQAAQALYRRAGALLEQAGLAVSRPNATVVSNLGALAFGQGDLKEAFRLFNKARLLREELHGALHLQTASAYYHLALVRRAMGHCGAALEDARTAHSIVAALCRDDDQDHPLLTEVCRLVAVIIRSRGAPSSPEETLPDPSPGRASSPPGLRGAEEAWDAPGRLRGRPWASSPRRGRTAAGRLGAPAPLQALAPRTSRERLSGWCPRSPSRSAESLYVGSVKVPSLASSSFARWGPGATVDATQPPFGSDWGSGMAVSGPEPSVEDVPALTFPALLPTAAH